MTLEVQIKKKLGKFLLDIAFTAEHTVHALMGTSGCGKSMTLKCIAGIVRPDEGRIVLDGHVLFDSTRGIDLPPQQRRVGLLFQQYALFPNMTTVQNISSGIRPAQRSRKKELTEWYVRMMQLEGLEHLYPAQLSGGQQQRVALARILASQPCLLMLDEPFSALDNPLRWQLEREMHQVLRSFAGTTLLVSHNRDEVYRLCDSVTVLADGRHSISDTKDRIFEHPRTYAAALLTGCKNIVPAERVAPGLLRVPVCGITLKTKQNMDGPVSFVGLRARQLLPAREKQENAFAYMVLEHIEDTFSHILMIRPLAGSEALCWEMSKEAYTALEHPDKGWVTIDPAHVYPLC